MLYLLLKGGLIVLAVAVVLAVRADRALRSLASDRLARLLASAISVLLIIGLTESLTETIFLYPLLYLGANLSEIQKAAARGITAPSPSDARRRSGFAPSKAMVIRSDAE